MITPGGESTFVGRMITESVTHKTRCMYVLPIPDVISRDNLPFNSKMVHLDAREAVLYIRGRGITPSAFGKFHE